MCSLDYLPKMTSESVLVRNGMLDESVDRDTTVTDSVFEWLAPRISFSNSFTHFDVEAPAKREESNMTSSDFEFSMSASSDDSLPRKFMLTADELFNDGKLLPLPISSQFLTSVEQASSAEDKEAIDITTAACLDKRTSDQASVSSPRRTSSDSSSSSLSLLSTHRPPKGASSWIALRRLFNLKMAMGVSAKGSSNRSAVSSRSWKLFGRGSPDGKAVKTQKLCITSSPTTSPDRVRTNNSQTLASLLLMPSQTSCCSFISENQDEVATEDDTIDYERHQVMDSRSVKTVYGQVKTVKRNPDSNNKVGVRTSSGKSASLPCSRISSPDREFEKDFLKKGLENMAIRSSTAYNTKKVSRVKMERCRSIPRGPGKLQNQDKTSKQWNYSNFPQVKKGVYDWKSYSNIVTNYPSGVRVAPVLNVPACLGPSLRKGNSKSNFTGFKDLFSRRNSDQHARPY